jgi:hypothetical protein
MPPAASGGPGSGERASGPEQAGSTAAAPGKQPLVRADLEGTFGWLGINKSELDTYSDWLGRSYMAGAGFGWYWTNHWKTSVDAGGSNEVSRYVPIQILDGPGGPLYGSREWRFRRTRIAVLHEYQFRENEWFHPYAGAGLELVHERATRRDDAVYVFGPGSREPVFVRPGGVVVPESEWKALAAVAGGFKWYFNRRGFLSSEARMTFDTRPEEMMLRVGAGVDF